MVANGTVRISAKLDNQKHAGYIPAVHGVKMGPDWYSHIQIPDQNTRVIRIADPDFFIFRRVQGFTHS
jgi:hypothetical protein